MAGKLFMVMLVSIVFGGAIGFGMYYSLFNNQIASVEIELSNLSTTVENLPTEWTQLDFDALSAKVNEIDARKWNLTYRESNDTTLASVHPDWYNTTTFNIHGKMLKLDWTLWTFGGGVFENIFIDIYFSNGTLFDSMGSTIPSGGINMMTSEIEYNVLPGDYYLSISLYNAGGPGTGWYEVNVWDYY